MIILVRHAMPVVDPATDPATWPLSPADTAAAATLAQRIPPRAVLVSSDERKALATLVAAAGSRPVAADPRLREVVRPRAQAGEDVRRAYVAACRAPAGWEPHHDVAARLDAAVDAHRVAGRPLVLAGHGMAFTVWLAARGLVADPAAFWADLGFPDLLALDDTGLHRPPPG